MQNTVRHQVRGAMGVRMFEVARQGSPMTYFAEADHTTEICAGERHKVEAWYEREVEALQSGAH